MSEQETFAIFVAVMGTLAIAQYFFFERAPVNFKRQWRPWVIVGNAVVFSIFAVVMVPAALWMVVLFVPIICWLQFRSTRICSCGATLYGNGFSPPAFCQKCGAKLTN